MHYYVLSTSQWRDSDVFERVIALTFEGAADGTIEGVLLNIIILTLPYMVMYIYFFFFLTIFFCS